jgi:hypothetical protein
MYEVTLSLDAMQQLSHQAAYEVLRAAFNDGAIDANAAFTIGVECGIDFTKGETHDGARLQVA